MGRQVCSGSEPHRREGNQTGLGAACKGNTAVPCYVWGWRHATLLACVRMNLRCAWSLRVAVTVGGSPPSPTPVSNFPAGFCAEFTLHVPPRLILLRLLLLLLVSLPRACFRRRATGPMCPKRRRIPAPSPSTVARTDSPDR